MASILDIYKKTPPKTGMIDTKGKDKTPLNPESSSSNESSDRLSVLPNQ